MKNLVPPPPYSSIEELTKWCNDLYEHIKYPIMRSAFRAKPASSILNITAGSNHDDYFDTVVFDINGDYTAASQIYTCPVDGIYLFDLYVELLTVNIDATYYKFGIVATTGGVLGEFKVDPNWSAALGYFSLTVSSGPVELTKDDTVFIRVYQLLGTETTDLWSSSRFSGFLLQHN